MNESPYDLAIVGAGSTGLIAAQFAVSLGARVLLLEKDRIGGDCTWTGCVPSKALLKVARIAHGVRTAGQYGVHTSTPTIDMPRVRDYLRAAIDQIYAGTTPEALQQKGIEVRLGDVRFLDAETLLCGGSRVHARKILIATGAKPVRPAIPGLDQVPFCTYREIFEADQLPQSMLVIGGGPIAVEIGQAYQRLGTQVTIVAPRLLPKEEPEVSTLIQRVFEGEGIRLVPSRAVSVERFADGIRVRTANATVQGEILFVATGRTPAVDGLGLEAAGVRVTKHGVWVNSRLRTTVKTIYAAGDVIGGPQFSHLAGWQGFQAARNALLPGSRGVFSAILPRITFCDPEVAQAGLLEAEARAHTSQAVQVGGWPILRVDRAVCDNERDGILKIIARHDGTILGATIVGQHAGEAITELVVAMQRKIRLADLAGVIHPYPTYGSGVQLLATEMATQQAMSGPSGHLLRLLSRTAR